MRPFLMWLILGALLFLCSCGQKQYSVHAYRLYTVNHHTENPSDDARASDMSPLKQTALHTELSY